jgi:hypothetical protein
VDRQRPDRGRPVAAEFLYDCDEATLGWALSTRRLFLSRAVNAERISLAPEIPSTYIVASHDRRSSPTGSGGWRATAWAWTPSRFPGHCPTVSQPGRLAEILVEVAHGA